MHMTLSRRCQPSQRDYHSPLPSCMLSVIGNRPLYVHSDICRTPALVSVSAGLYDESPSTRCRIERAMMCLPPIDGRERQAASPVRVIARLLLPYVSSVARSQDTCIMSVPVLGQEPVPQVSSKSVSGFRSYDRR